MEATQSKLDAPSMLVDENAFGLLLSYYSIEDDEYGLEREAFVTRFTEFRSLVLDYLTSVRVCENGTVLDFGHGLYLEFPDGSQREDPLSYAKAGRAMLSGRRFESAAVLTYGGRWVQELDTMPERSELGDGLRLTQLSRPSEPLRKALAADAASRKGGEDDESGWGPGLYVDAEALDALGRAPKNTPTTLEIAGSVFYRAGR